MRRKYSIVITVYNSRKFLSHCLRSVQQQKYDNWELILVNDGSTDGSERICEEFEKSINTDANSNSEVIYFSHENRGTVYSRERGIRACTGDYVFFMDADDWWEENLLEKIDGVINSTHADIIQYGYTFKDEQGNDTTDCDMHRKGGNGLGINEVVNDSNVFAYRALRMCYSLWSRAFRRDLFDTEQGFYKDYYDVNMTNDLLAFSRPLSKARSYCFTDLYLYNYRIVSSSLCHDVSIKKICSYFKSISWAEKCMSDANGYTKEHKGFFAERLCNIIFDEYRERIYTSKIEDIKKIYNYADLVSNIDEYIKIVLDKTTDWYKRAYLRAFINKKIFVPKLLYYYSLVRRKFG